MVFVTVFSLFTKDVAMVLGDSDDVDTSVSVAYIIMLILFSGIFSANSLLTYLLTRLLVQRNFYYYVIPKQNIVFTTGCFIWMGWLLYH